MLHELHRVFEYGTRKDLAIFYFECLSREIIKIKVFLNFCPWAIMLNGKSLTNIDEVTFEVLLQL